VGRKKREERGEEEGGKEVEREGGGKKGEEREREGWRSERRGGRSAFSFY